MFSFRTETKCLVAGERLTFQSWSPQPQQQRWDGNRQTSQDPAAEEEMFSLSRRAVNIQCPYYKSPRWSCSRAADGSEHPRDEPACPERRWRTAPWRDEHPDPTARQCDPVRQHMSLKTSLRPPEINICSCKKYHRVQDVLASAHVPAQWELIYQGRQLWWWSFWWFQQTAPLVFLQPEPEQAQTTHPPAHKHKTVAQLMLWMLSASWIDREGVIMCELKSFKLKPEYKVPN